MLQVGVDVMKQYSHMSRADLTNSLAKAEQQLGTQLGELKATKLSQAECQLELAQTKIAYRESMHLCTVQVSVVITDYLWKCTILVRSLLIRTPSTRMTLCSARARSSPRAVHTIYPPRAIPRRR